MVTACEVKTHIRNLSYDFLAQKNLLKMPISVKQQEL